MTTELFLSYDRVLGAYNAEVVTDRHFGVNLLFDRDRNVLDSSGSTVSPNFDAAMRELGVQTFRYPGGTLTERFSTSRQLSIKSVQLFPGLPELSILTGRDLFNQQR